MTIDTLHPRVWALVWLAVASAPAVAAAGKVKGPAAKRQTVALFPLLTRDTPEQAVVDAVADLLVQASSTIEEIKVVADLPLRRALKGDPAKALERCGSDLTCIARLGRKAKAREVLLGRASPAEAGGVAIQFLVVDVKSRELARKVSLTFADVAAVKGVLGGSFYELFGLTEPGAIEVADAAGPVRIDGAVVGEGPGPYPVPPGRHAVEANGLTLTIMVGPGKTRSIQIAEGTPVEGEPEELALALPELDGAPPTEPAAAPVAGGAEPGGDYSLEELGIGLTAAAEPPPAEPIAVPPVEPIAVPAIEPAVAPPEPVALASAAPPAPAERSRLLAWTGVAVAGAGVALAGAGGYFGLRARSIAGEIGPGRHTQLEALAEQRDANSAAARANLLWIAGGAAVLLGAAAAAVDLFVLSPPVALAPADGGVQASVCLPF